MQFQFAWPEYECLHEHATSFAALTASTDVVALESLNGAPYGDPLPGQTVSANFFADLGVKPLLGRTFQADEEAAVVLRYGFWRQKLHGDSNVLGQSIKLNGIPSTIIVMPQEFRGTALAPVPSAFWYATSDARTA